MSWDVYAEISAIREAKGAAAALAEIERRADVAKNFPPLTTLRAAYLEQLGRSHDAVAALFSVHEQNPGEYWSNYNLARILNSLGQYEASVSHMRQSHAALGWTESSERGYNMTHDFFSPNIPRWQEYFANLVGKPGVRFLEIGSWQGGSAMWLLDKVLTAPDAHLTCIDTWEGSSEHQNWIKTLPQTIEQIFDENIQKTGAAHKIRKLKNYSQNALRALQNEIFDAIYIDGAHEAQYVIQDTILSWSILKPEGLMLFDDYSFAFADRPEQNTARAINFFLEVFSNDVELLAKERQVLIRKKKS